MWKPTCGGNLWGARATGEDKKKFEDGRDDLAKSMTPAQVTEVERRAREWTEAFVVRHTAQANAKLDQPALQRSDVTITPWAAEPPPAQDAAGSIVSSRVPSSAGKQSPAAEQQHPSLRINTMEVIPDVVQAGSKFNIVLEYTVADPTMNRKGAPRPF